MPQMANGARVFEAVDTRRSDLSSPSMEALPLTPLAASSIGLPEPRRAIVEHLRSRAGIFASPLVGVTATAAGGSSAEASGCPAEARCCPADGGLFGADSGPGDLWRQCHGIQALSTESTRSTSNGLVRHLGKPPWSTASGRMTA